MGSAKELSPPINPVWRIIPFPSSGQTLSVMKWPEVLPCNPVTYHPSNSACLRGKKGLTVWLQPHSTCAQWLCHLQPAPNLTYLHLFFRHLSFHMEGSGNLISCRAHYSSYASAADLCRLYCLFSLIQPSLLSQFPSFFLTIFSPHTPCFQQKNVYK